MRHALPLDVRLMNATASVLFAGCAVLLLAVLSWWAVRHPAFSIARIVVDGELVHNNAVTLRANVAALAATHRIAAAAAFDQFPYTHHLECGLLLQRR